MIDWNRHIFYMLGYIYKCILNLDINGTIDNYYWLKIHLTSKSSSNGKMKFMKEELYGYVGTILIIIFIKALAKNI